MACWHAFVDLPGNIAQMTAGEWAVRLIVYSRIPRAGYGILMTWVYAHTGSVATAWPCTPHTRVRCMCSRPGDRIIRMAARPDRLHRVQRVAGRVPHLGRARRLACAPPVQAPPTLGERWVAHRERHRRGMVLWLV